MSAGQNVSCQICYEEFRDLGEIDSCDHIFCYPCISKWSGIENRCPLCRTRFQHITRRILPSPRHLKFRLSGDALHRHHLPGSIVGIEDVVDRNQRMQFEDPNFQDWINSLLCMTCGGDQDESQLLICDDCCLVACHTYCIGLIGVPEGEWYCTSCTARQGSAAVPGNNTTTEQQPASRVQRRAHTDSVNSIEELIDDVVDVMPPHGNSRPSQPRRNALVIDDDEEEEENREGSSSGRPADRRRRSRQPGGQKRQRETSNLRGFIVSDDETESEFDADGEYRPARANRQGRRPNARRQRQARFDDSGSESMEGEIDEDEWVEDSDEDVEEKRRTGNKWTRPVIRIGLKNNRNQQEEVSISGWRTTQRKVNSVAVSRVAQSSRQIQITTESATADHRRTETLARNWEAIRSGTATFQDVLGPRQQERHPGTTHRQSRKQKNSDPNDVGLVDLTSPMANYKKQAFTDRRQSGGVRTRGAGPRTVSTTILSPPLISLGARLRAELQQCRERGAQLPPSRPKRPSPVIHSHEVGGRASRLSAGEAPTRPPHTTPSIHRGHLGHPGITPGSEINANSGGRRMRTKADFSFGSAVVRNARVEGRIPCSPRPLRERLQERTAEWGRQNGDRSGPLSPSNKPPMQISPLLKPHDEGGWRRAKRSQYGDTR